MCDCTLIVCIPIYFSFAESIVFFKLIKTSRSVRYAELGNIETVQYIAPISHSLAVYKGLYTAISHSYTGTLYGPKYLDARPIHH